MRERAWAVPVALLGCIATTLVYQRWPATSPWDIVKESALATFAVAGPVNGEFLAQSAANFQLDPELVQNASLVIQNQLPNRACTLLIKNGTLIHETYMNGWDKSSLIPLDDLAKTMAAFVIGRAILAGLIDPNLERPLKDYGVKPTNGMSPKFFLQLTVRDLLSQTSGLGRVPPGKVFEQDHDGQYTQLLSHLMRAVLPNGPTPVKWAKDNLLKPLGIPRFFDYDDLAHGHFNAAGGQMGTCRDVARMAQLIMNRGKWPKSPTWSGGQLVPAAFIDQMRTPAKPEVVHTHGFFTWLNTKSDSSHASCCSLAQCTRKKAAGPDELALQSDPGALQVHDQLVPGARTDVVFLAGRHGRAAVIFPSWQTIVVSLGFVWTNAHECTLRNDVAGENNTVVLGMLHSAVQPIFDLTDTMEQWKKDDTRELSAQPKGLAVGPDVTPARAQSVETSDAILEKNEGKSLLQTSTRKKSARQKTQMHEVAAEHETAMHAFVEASNAKGMQGRSLLEVSPDLIKAQAAAAGAASAAAREASVEDASKVLGHVRCTCAPLEKFGRCFDVTKSMVQKSLADHGQKRKLVQEHLMKGEGFCPDLGVLQPCKDAFKDESGDSCGTPPFITKRTPDGTGREFTDSPFSCKLVPGAACTAGFKHQQCNCVATAFQECRVYAGGPCPRLPQFTSADIITKVPDVKQCPNHLESWCF